MTRAAPTINRVWPKVKGIVRVTSTQNFEDFKGFQVLNRFSKTLISHTECSTKRKFTYFSVTKAYLKKGPRSNPRFFTKKFVESIRFEICGHLMCPLAC